MSATGWIASLPMYARPELAPALDALWALMRDDLRRDGIAAPEALCPAPDDLIGHWQRPDLLFSQTCGLPFRRVLHSKVALIGSPDFGLPGCPPGHYRSALVVRREDSRDSLAAFAGAPFAVNETMSQSGYAAPLVMAEARGIRFGPRRISGAHRASALMVAAGQADIAAIDAVSWRHMTMFDDWSVDLRVLDWTPPTPGLPFITAAPDLAPRIAEALARANAALPADLSSRLGLQAVVLIARATYLRVPDPVHLL